MKKGTAYGFFHCEALKEEIERELPNLKKEVRIPDLDLILMDTPDVLTEDLALGFFVEEAGSFDLNYVLRATSRGQNQSTALKLSQLLMQISQSYLDKSGEVWRNVIYKDADGKYIFLK